MQSDRSDNPDVPPVHVARPRPYRARRAMWGIGALAMSPDAVPEGPRRKRLLRAATLTSAMGIAWASTAGGAPASSSAPSFDHIGLPSVDADEESMQLSSPLPRSWQQMHDAAPAKPDDVEPASDAATASPDMVTPKARTREQASVRPAQRGGDISAAPDPDAWRTNVVASHEQVDLVQMSDETVLVGFHEAAMPGAKPLAVASTPDADHGRGQVSFSNVDDPLDTVILPTRARATNAASAMDVVIPAREAVFTPVTGTVTEVDHYQLYGRYPDNRMVIVPDARPDLRVVILHIEGLKVDPGDKVTAGRTKIAVGANPFPFESQVDRFARPLMPTKGDATPHVHVELR